MILDIYNSDLTNSNYWEIEYFETRQVAYTEVGRRTAYHPIPDFTIPLLARSRIMACNFNNPQAKEHWKLGCYLKQSIPSPQITTEGSFADLVSFRIPLQSYQIFFPLSAVNAWQLRASIPSWHETAQITVYRFVGPIDAPLAARLTEIENKLNFLTA